MTYAWLIPCRLCSFRFWALAARACLLRVSFKGAERHRTPCIPQFQGLVHRCSRHTMFWRRLPCHRMYEACVGGESPEALHKWACFMVYSCGSQHSRTGAKNADSFALYLKQATDHSIRWLHNKISKLKNRRQMEWDCSQLRLHVFALDPTAAELLQLPQKQWDVDLEEMRQCWKQPWHFERYLYLFRSLHPIF